MTTNITVGFVGDLHFHYKNYKDMNASLNLAVDVLLKEKVDVVIQLGDIFDHYNVSTSQTSVATILYAAKSPFDRLGKEGIKTYIVEGNHDKGAKGQQGEMYRASIELLEDEHIIPITKPNVIQIKEGVSLLALPWATGEENLPLLIDKLNETNKDDLKILAGHFVLEGAHQHGYVLTDGDFYLSQEDLRKINWDIAAAGHIHHRQDIYAGIIMQDSLRDHGAPTGVRIVRVKDGLVVHDKFSELRTPKYHLIELNDPDPNVINETVNNVNNFDKYVVRVIGKKHGNIKTPENVRLEYRPDNQTTSRINIQQEKIDKMSVTEMFVMWAKRSEYPDELIESAVCKLREDGIK